MSQESRRSLAWSPGSGSLTRLQSRRQPRLRLCQGSTGRTHSQAHSCGCWQDLLSHKLDGRTWWLLDEGHPWSRLRGCLHKGSSHPSNWILSEQPARKQERASPQQSTPRSPTCAGRQVASWCLWDLFIPFSCNSLAVVKFQPDSRRSRNAFFL